MSVWLWTTFALLCSGNLKISVDKSALKCDILEAQRQPAKDLKQIVRLMPFVHVKLEWNASLRKQETVYKELCHPLRNYRLYVTPTPWNSLI